jgi:hypothetical protein
MGIRVIETRSYDSYRIQICEQSSAGWLVRLYAQRGQRGHDIRCFTTDAADGLPALLAQAEREATRS